MFSKKQQEVLSPQDELDFDIEDSGIIEEEHIDFGEEDGLDFDTGEEEASIDFGTDESQQEPIDFSTNDNQEEESQKENTSHKEIQQIENAESTKNTENTEGQKLQDIVLHFVIDKSTSDMLDYFRGYGVNVSRIFNNIEEAKNEILMQINPCRIVIVDTGTGKFSLMGARKALVDLLGIGDEDNKITVFYTDSVIKDDISMAEEVDNKQIDWIKYRSTADILATLLQKSKKENYIIDDTLEETKKTTSTQELMQFKGLTLKDETVNIGQPTISVEEITINREENSGNTQLQAYEVKY